jgi:hypothetical protein
LLRWAGVAGLLLAVLVLRVVTAAAAELKTADGYRQAGDLEAAIVHYRRAARWYAPGSPFHTQALAKLGAIGTAADARGDGALALSAYRAVRGAIMATRSFYVTEPKRLAAADERIASLMAAQPATPGDAGKSRATLRREHLALLSRDPAPRLGWTLLLLVGFATWVSSTFAFSLRAVDAADRFVPGEARRWGVLIVVGFGLFVLGMTQA